MAAAILFLLSMLRPPCAGATAPGDDPLFGDTSAIGVAEGFPDPIEPINRAVFGFNRQLDHWVLDPVTAAYDLVVPRVARLALRRMIDNLDAPSVFVNDVLQAEPVDAGVTVGRFVLNTMFGAVGALDIGALMGLDGHTTDFGQTLALYGVPSGPFLVLPVIGPTTLRDGTGYLVDFWFRPTTYLLTPLANIVVTSVRDGTAGFALLDAHASELDALEASSMDFYAALRSAYYQDRVGKIRKRRESRRPLSYAAR